MNVKFGVEESMQKWEYEIPETVNVTNFTNLFHLRTRTAYVWTSGVLSRSVNSTDPLKREILYSQLRQSANTCDVSDQPTRTLYMDKKSPWQETRN